MADGSTSAPAATTSSVTTSSLTVANRPRPIDSRDPTATSTRRARATAHYWAVATTRWSRAIAATGELAERRDARVGADEPDSWLTERPSWRASNLGLE